LVGLILARNKNCSTAS